MVHWDLMETVLEGTSRSFHLWVTKHISRFCSVNRCRYLMKEITSHMWPICKLEGSIETRRHQLVCKDSTRKLLWEYSTKELEEWLIKFDTMPELINLITRYILGRGEVSATSLLQHNSLNSIVEIMNPIGWFNFMEGKIPISLYHHQESFYKSTASFFTIKTWGAQLVYRLLGIFRSQCLYRNEVGNKKNKTD